MRMTHDRAPQGASVRTAVVTTVRKPPRAMWHDFLSYHLFIGFDHIFVFHDDPDDVEIGRAHV